MKTLLDLSLYFEILIDLGLQMAVPPGPVSPGGTYEATCPGRREPSLCRLGEPSRHPARPVPRVLTCQGAPEAQGGPLACVSHACAPAWGVSEAGRVGARERQGQSQTDSGSSRHCSQDLHVPCLRGSGLYALGCWQGWRGAPGGVAHVRGRVRRGPGSPSFFP